jgi:hypothetical protein
VATDGWGPDSLSTWLEQQQIDFHHPGMQRDALFDFFADEFLKAVSRKSGNLQLAGQLPSMTGPTAGAREPPRAFPLRFCGAIFSGGRPLRRSFGRLEATDPVLHSRLEALWLPAVTDSRDESSRFDDEDCVWPQSPENVPTDSSHFPCLRVKASVQCEAY